MCKLNNATFEQGKLKILQMIAVVLGPLRRRRCWFRSNCLQNTLIYALGSYMKSSASESKPFVSRSKGEISRQARRKKRLSRSKLKQAFLIDSDAELFMYLIQYIRFGSWKVRCQSWFLFSVKREFNQLLFVIGDLKDLRGPWRTWII